MLGGQTTEPKFDWIEERKDWLTTKAVYGGRRGQKRTCCPRWILSHRPYKKSRLCALIRAKMGTLKPRIWAEITLKSGCNHPQKFQTMNRIYLTGFWPEKVQKSTYYMFSLAVLFLYYRKSFEAIHSHRKGEGALVGGLYETIEVKVIDRLTFNHY